MVALQHRFFPWCHCERKQNNLGFSPKLQTDVPILTEIKHNLFTKLTTTKKILYNFPSGEMSEWFMELVLKTSVAVRSPGVRIPLSPPYIKMLHFVRKRETENTC